MPIISAIPTGDQNIFWATYGTTTIDEVVAARSAGKLVMMEYDTNVYTMMQLTVQGTVKIANFLSMVSGQILTDVTDAGAAIGKGVLLSSTAGWGNVEVQMFNPRGPLTTNLLKGNGKMGIIAATPDTDYATPSYVTTAIENAIGSAIGGDY